MGRTRIEKIIPVSSWTISEWIRNFVAENPSYKSQRMKQAEERRKKKAVLESVDSPVPSDMDSLKAEVARLRKALKDESIRADLYNEIINVAEEQFKIPILKKAGTKQ
jgi:hypothetical protein